jgi:hypothetical protein
MAKLLRIGGLVAIGSVMACSSAEPPSLSGLESFQVTITDPAPGNLGTPNAPVTFRDVVLDLRAIDSQGATFVRDLDADVFLSFAGNKIGEFTPCGDSEDAKALTTVHLARGVAQQVHLQLPKAYGASTLWIQETPTPTSGQAAGASPTIYFPNPTIPELQMPLDLTATTATWCTPFNGKHVTVDHATDGGKLVVTSVFPDAFVIADTGANYDDATGNGGFNHLYVFPYNKPPIEIVPGRLLTQSDVAHPALSGNVMKFVGFTELDFPLQNAVDTIDPSLMPPVYALGANDRLDGLKLLKLSSATVSVTGQLCMIAPNDTEWTKYNQIVVNMNGQCDPTQAFTVTLPGKTLGDFDPTKLRQGIGAQRLTATGMLRNNSGQSAQNPTTGCTVDADCAMFATQSCVSGTCRKGPYNFWSVMPRGASDIVLCGGAGQACCPTGNGCDANLGCSGSVCN